MAHKGEEIAQLKIKLQAAELKLKDFEMNSQRRAETTETQSKPEVVPVTPVTPVAPEQPVTVPEIDVEGIVGCLFDFKQYAAVLESCIMNITPHLQFYLVILSIYYCGVKHV